LSLTTHHGGRLFAFLANNWVTTVFDPGFNFASRPPHKSAELSTLWQQAIGFKPGNGAFTAANQLGHASSAN
jgi:hypothetical protein